MLFCLFVCLFFCQRGDRSHAESLEYCNNFGFCFESDGKTLGLMRYDTIFNLNNHSGGYVEPRLLWEKLEAGH